MADLRDREAIAAAFRAARAADDAAAMARFQNEEACLVLRGRGHAPIQAFPSGPAGAQ